MSFYPRVSFYESILKKSKKDKQVNNILEKAKRLEFISLEDLGILIRSCDNSEIKNDIFETAKYITEKVFGDRIVIFAPLYYSNICRNDCVYCGFKRSRKIKRIRLDEEKFRFEVRELINKGFKSIEIVSGEDPFFDAKKVGNLVKIARSEGVRQILCNIGVFDDIKSYITLKASELNSFILFIETYHPTYYSKYHPKNTHKGDYRKRLAAYDLAAQAGITNLGLGILLGLYDWKFELLAIVDHARYLIEKYNVIISISVPRLMPISGIIKDIPFKVTNEDFLLFVGLLRIALPFAFFGISTRESREVRRKALAIGGTSTSAESYTGVGGYYRKYTTKQFPNYTVSLLQTINDVIRIGKIPSFCTTCSELNLNGKDFYNLAQSGKLKEGCYINSILSLEEFYSKKLYKRHIVYDFSSDKILIVH